MGVISVLNIVLIIVLLYIISIQSTTLKYIEATEVDIQPKVDTITIAKDPTAELRMAKKFVADTNSRIHVIESEMDKIDTKDIRNKINKANTLTNELQKDDSYIQHTLANMNDAIGSFESQTRGMLMKNPTPASYIFSSTPYRSALLPPLVVPVAASPASVAYVVPPALKDAVTFPDVLPAPNFPPSPPVATNVLLGFAKTKNELYVEALYANLLKSLKRYYDIYLSAYNSAFAQYQETNDPSVQSIYVSTVNNYATQTYNDSFSRDITNYNNASASNGYKVLSTNPNSPFYQALTSYIGTGTHSAPVTQPTPLTSSLVVPNASMTVSPLPKSLSIPSTSALAIPSPTLLSLPVKLAQTRFPDTPPTNNNSVAMLDSVVTLYNTTTTNITNYYNIYVLAYSNIQTQFNSGKISQASLPILLDTLNTYTASYLYQYSHEIDNYNTELRKNYSGFTFLNRDATMPPISSSATYTLSIYPVLANNALQTSKGGAPSANNLPTLSNIVLTDALLQNYPFITRTPGYIWDGKTPVNLTVNVLGSLSSSDPNIPALSTGTFPGGSAVTIISSFTISGAAGQGGQPGKKGGNGGIALSIACPVTLMNNGSIAGGGGGGGGGVSKKDVGGIGQGGVLNQASTLTINMNTNPPTGSTGGPGGNLGMNGSTAIGGAEGGSAGAAIALNGNKITYQTRGVIVGNIIL